MNKYKLSTSEQQTALTELPGWQIENDKLTKQFKFPSFAAAIGWMVQVSITADKLNHHPEWSNVYNRVSVQLATHDLDNSISNLDLQLAQTMESAARHFA